MLLASALEINVLTFFGVFCIIVAADSLFFDVNRSAKRKGESLARKRQAERDRRRIHEALSIGDMSHLAIRPREAKKKLSIRARLENVILQADGAISFGRFRAMSLMSALVGTLSMYVISRSIVIGLVAMVFFAGVPLILLIRLRHKRREKILSQLSDAFGLMSRVMRSGQTISQAMESVAEEMDPPISQEFLYCSERIKLGMEPGAALGDMASRTGLTELRIFVLAVMVHRSCGGNLVTLIDLLEELVRERYRIRGLVHTVTAQGRTQSVILTAMPALIFVGLWFSNREYTMKLLEHRWMLWTALGLTVTGYLWVRRICRIEL